jgi:hypothetical protein
MRTRTSVFLLFFFLSGIGILRGQTLRDTLVIDFKVIDETINEKVNKYGAENVLVVLDIDNTLLTGDTDLGSDIWYQWQNGELEIKPSPEQKLTKDCLYNEAIGLLYELGTMRLTDSLLPEYIPKWQDSGVTVFALTSRSPKYRAATERELLRNDIDLSVSELTTIDSQRMSFSYNLSRDVSYSDGIFMTTGLNKGEMLLHILNRSGRSFKAIIFADDTRKNIDAVKFSYTPCNNSADIVLFHYTGIITERLKKNNDQVLTQEQADEMDRDWDLLIQTLITIFSERIAKSDCMR